MSTTWVVELETDPETGDLIMPLPEAMLAELNWQIGDTLVWNINPDTQEISLTRKNHEQEPQPKPGT
jgi:hypothetical protein